MPACTRAVLSADMAELVEPVPASSRAASSDDVDLMRVRTGLDRTWRTLRRNPIFWVGLAMAGAMVGAAVLAPVLAPYDPLEQFRDAIPASGDPAGPSDRFLLGTDRSGRDYLSRLLWGARTSLVIGIGANVIATILGLAVGATAAIFARNALVPPAGVGWNAFFNGKFADSVWPAI